MRVYDPRSPATRDDPYPIYREMREHEPVLHMPSAGTWFVTSHEHCLAALRDPRLSARKGQRMRLRSSALPVSMLTTDPPEHTRLRHAAAAAFDPAAMTRTKSWMRPVVGSGVRRVCRALDAGAEVDLAGDFAQPLAAAVLARFLGLHGDEVEEFARWGRAVAVNLDPFADPDADADAGQQMRAMLERFADHLQRRTVRPTDDALTVLARSHQAGALSPGEALATAGLLVVGGLEPLADLVANSAAALLGLSARPVVPEGRSRTAVDELLRFDAPIQFTARHATADIDLDGQRIPAGDNLVVLLGAANHDPARFADPDHLALDRRTNPHLSFGAGAHACLGAPLARLFGELIIDALPRPLPVLAPGGTAPTRRRAVVPRGYESLPIRGAAHQP